jgi:hypothetical protein
LTMQTMLVMQSDPKAIYVGHCKIMLVLQAWPAVFNHSGKAWLQVIRDKNIGKSLDKRNLVMWYHYDQWANQKVCGKLWLTRSSVSFWVRPTKHISSWRVNVKVMEGVK